MKKSYAALLSERPSPRGSAGEWARPRSSSDFLYAEGLIVGLGRGDGGRQGLHASILSHVRPGARLVTDEWPGYNRLRSCGYRRHRVRHEETYVKGQKQTNTVEGFWSLLKRCIRATHAKARNKHLYYYLAEAGFRYNLRLQPDRLKATFQARLVPLRG